MVCAGLNFSYSFNFLLFKNHFIFINVFFCQMILQWSIIELVWTLVSYSKWSVIEKLFGREFKFKVSLVSVAGEMIEWYEGFFFYLVSFPLTPYKIVYSRRYLIHYHSLHLMFLYLYVFLISASQSHFFIYLMHYFKLITFMCLIMCSSYPPYSSTRK